MLFMILLLEVYIILAHFIVDNLIITYFLKKPWKFKTEKIQVVTKLPMSIQAFSLVYLHLTVIKP